MDLINKINAVWQKIGIVQRAMLAAVTMTFIAAAVFVTQWAQNPDLGLLYSNLTASEAGMIVEKVSEQGIAYKLKAGGTSVYVPFERIAELRLSLAKEGLPQDSQKGYSIFDNEKIGVSPIVQNVNLKRALQEELAKSIQMIEGVEYARVHIVSTKQSFLRPDDSDTSASVILKLRSGFGLSMTNIAAISHLVAGSVQSLKAENIKVVDNKGRLLSGSSDQAFGTGSGSMHDYKERVEQNLSAKVEQMLASVLGPGRASVRVSAVIDMTSSSIVTEKYDSAGKVPTKEEISKTVEKENTASSSGDNQQPLGNEKTDQTTLTEYLVGKTIEQKTELPGEIVSLAVAAFVDLSPYDQAAADGSETETTTQTGPVMAIADIEEVIRNSLGLKETDALKVVDTKFNRPVQAEEVVDEGPNWQLYMAIAKQGSVGLMVVCALIVLKIFSKGTKTSATELASVNANQIAGANGQMGMLPQGTGQTEQMFVLRQQIANAMQSNPDRAKQLFNSWVNQNGE